VSLKAKVLVVLDRYFLSLLWLKTQRDGYRKEKLTEGYFNGIETSLGTESLKLAMIM
jgi:hypothetical protein